MKREGEFLHRHTFPTKRLISPLADLPRPILPIFRCDNAQIKGAGGGNGGGAAASHKDFIGAHEV